MLTATRRAYVQVRCAVVALWSERNQLYASQTRPGKSNLTQNSGFAGCSFLDDPDAVQLVGGFRRDTTTLVMQARLSPGLRLHDGVVRASIADAARAGDEPVPFTDLGEPDTEPGLTGWVMVHDELALAGAWSFLHEQDCGVYAVGTVPGWRRRGLARSLVEHVLADARGHGARTATLQSTRIAQQLTSACIF